MIITRTTSPQEVAQIMGSNADEHDGRLLRDYLVAEYGDCDTEYLTDSEWNMAVLESRGRYHTPILRAH